MTSCQECLAIYRELLELVEISRQSKPGPDATPQQLGAWFERRDECEEYVKRVRPALPSLKRRLIEHQRVTGHTVPTPTPKMPGGFANLN